MSRKTMMFVAVSLAALIAGASSAQDSRMSFFVTSTGSGEGGNLGGLAGADAHCKALATAVDAGDRDWRAYLSTSTVNARDRIGTGPWYNAKGVKVADSVETLHGEGNALGKAVALDEAGNVVNGRGDTPNRHDVLTGSGTDGRAIGEMTCKDWTSGDEGTAMVGHHDRTGLRDDAPSKSWNASHPSRGCSQDALRATGGDGLFYCFAAN